MGFGSSAVPAVLVALALGVLLASIRIRRARSALGRVLLGAAVVLAAAVAGSTVWNAVALRSHTPAPFGSIYTVEARRMHIDCTGAGSPVLVLESGLGDDGLIWGEVQPALSSRTRVCSYDRAGYGWSEPGPAPRDADHIARELHGLLMQAGVSVPVVLMGHSIGGLYIRDYAARYPKSVAGLVFIDSSAGPGAPSRNAGQHLQRVGDLFTEMAYATNLPRLAGVCSLARPGARAWMLETQNFCHSQLPAMRAERESFDRSGQEALAAGSFGVVPVLIFSHDPGRGQSDREAAWSRRQEDLKKLSTRSRRIVAKGSSHYVQLDRAGLVVREVGRFVEEIRRGRSPQAGDSSTVTE